MGTDINSKYYKIFMRQEIEIADSRKALSSKENVIKKFSELDRNLIVQNAKLKHGIRKLLKEYNELENYCRKKGLDLSPDVISKTLSSDTGNQAKRDTK